LLTLLAATLFIGFNLDNRCDVSWVFGTFRDVPIFVSLLFAFTAGVIAAIPFKLRGNRRDSGPVAPRGDAYKAGATNPVPRRKPGKKEASKTE